MEIIHDKEKNTFAMINDEDKIIGLIEYRVANPHLIYATHSEVLPEYEGNGYATKIFDYMVTYARENKIKIFPICVFVKNKFNKHKAEYMDVIADNYHGV
ncbi:MAG: N-acetyltransferase [Lachnospiraceae bacterium]|jgi:predicted GNAT family acetyltransferase|nr:N-acetyltransferase [Lachnospiraceae bacterium]